jgi:hypothetical protein
MDETQSDADHLAPDERAAIRAYLQRSEVRLSTFHRTALAMLSGAGLLVVLPVIARDSISGVLRSLFVGEFGWIDGLLVVAVGAVLLAPAVAMWLLFRDLTRFYFHANHLETTGAAAFTPRFTLTALRLPSDELGPVSAAALDRARHDPRMVELLVPTNDASRARIDRQIQVYGGLGVEQGAGDQGRAKALSTLAASVSRPLVEEVAKVEYGMARHLLRLQGIVLRYVKVLLTVLTSALAIYAADAVVAGLDPSTGIGPSEALWLAAVVLMWAPAVVIAASSPVRWIEQLMRADGATSTAVADDPELTFIERVLVRIAAVGYLGAAAAMVAATTMDTVTDTQRLASWAVLLLSAVVVATSFATGRITRLFALH